MNTDAIFSTLEGLGSMATFLTGIVNFFNTNFFAKIPEMQSNWQKFVEFLGKIPTLLGIK